MNINAAVRSQQKLGQDVYEKKGLTVHLQGD